MSVTAVETIESRTSAPRPVREFSIDYLRTAVTLLVIAHHSVLAYATWAVPPTKNVFHIVVPIVDVRRSRFFDYLIAWDDSYLMVLMFFISGLFAYPALKRHGAAKFVRERLLRLGVPFALVIFVVSPIGYNMVWQASGHTTGFVDMYKHLAANGFSAGPAWFIWLLLAYDIVFALVMKVFAPVAARPQFDDFFQSMQQFVRRLKGYPAATAGVLFVLCVFAYLPLLFRYGYTTWTNIVTPPFIMQPARFLLYPIWFVSGVLVGAWGFSSGLIARDGALARRWALWLAASLVFNNALWLLLRYFATHPGFAHTRTPPALLWVATCITTTFASLAIFIRIPWRSIGWVNSISRCAYGMYLVHYIFIIWTQRRLLGVPAHPFLKAATVFVATAALSWLTTKLLLKLPKAKTIL